MEKIITHNTIDNSCNSKLSEINDILSITERDSKRLKMEKTNLQYLLHSKKYKEFQKKIWMNDKDCDWKIWQKTLDQLISYVLWVDEKKWWVTKTIWEYIRSVFSFKPKKEENTSESKSSGWNIEIHNNWQQGVFLWTHISFIESCSRIKNDETDSYRCSMTARINWSHFWLSLPRWNAYVAWTIPGLWMIQSLPVGKSNEKPLKSWPAITSFERNAADPSANFADFFADSKTTYWHRAVAFKDGCWQRYVLDPYIKIWWKLTQQPIKLETYLKYKKVLKVNFYRSHWYSSFRKAS